MAIFGSADARTAEGVTPRAASSLAHAVTRSDSVDFSNFSKPFPLTQGEADEASYRDLLTQLLSTSTRDDLALYPAISRIFRTYRSKSSSAGMALQQGPYVGLLLGQKMGELYGPAYDSAYAENYENLVNQVSAEALMDGFLQLVAVGDTPPGLEKISKQIGSCLAAQVLAGKSPYCLIADEAGRPLARKPLLPQFLLTRWRCKRDSSFAVLALGHGEKDRARACTARRKIYALAYKSLQEKRKDPQVVALIRAKFESEFPKTFREQFLSQLSEHYQNLPILVASKFGGVLDPLWARDVPLLESTSVGSSGGGSYKLRDFALGLQNDLRASRTLLEGARVGLERGELTLVQAANLRGLAGPLFYAAANRLLVLTGGQEARWNSASANFVLKEGDQGGEVYDPAHPKAAPRFELNAFGGWAMAPDLTASHPVKFENWDWANYNPLENTATSLRIFPQEWWMGARGVPVHTGREEGSQDFGDLVELMSGLVSFLEATGEKQILRPYFGVPSELGGILDRRLPVLFPLEGRELAVGMLAGVLKNVVVPFYGHIESVLETQRALLAKFALKSVSHSVSEVEPPPLGLRFFQKVEFAGRGTDPAFTPTLARFISVATELRGWLLSDPSVPPALQEYLPQVNGAIQTGALLLGAQGQGADGSFESGTPRALDATLEGIGALTGAYNLSEILLIRVRLRAGWQALEREWMRDGASGVGAIQGWKWLALWERTQVKVRGGLDDTFAPEVQWPLWDARMAELREKMMTALRSGRGPL